jgi:hypothetical protein
VLLACVVAAAVSPSAAADRPPLTRRAPYLIYPGVNTEMDVHWQLFTTDTSVVEWGPDTTYSAGVDTTTE